jgi:mRNA interferase RelE/StbE
MTYTVLFKPSAKKAYGRLPLDARRRIASKINGLAQNPFPPGVVKLAGEENTYRIRIGDYRVIYDVLQERVIVLVLRIGHRREVYR